MDNLLNYSLESNPLESFKKWYSSAQTCEQNPEAMSLATYDSVKNRPSIRTVLFKGFDEQNRLTFYTNYLSPKSMELENNPEACLVFYWHLSKKQVRIHGRVKKMAESASQKYFHSRDRESQLASYISHQSSPIENKDKLLEKLNLAKEQFKNKEIPLPAHWGGFVFEAYEFEFFLYGEHRLNDRFLYTINNQQTWNITRLQP